MNINSSLIAELKDKDYRDAYVASQIAIGLPFQVRALRVGKGWTQTELAERAGMTQPRIAEIEKTSERRFNLETLLRIASAHDVGLEVRFVSYGQLIALEESFDPDSFEVPSFEEEFAAAQKKEQADLARTELAKAAVERISHTYPNAGTVRRSWNVFEGTPAGQTSMDFMRAHLWLAVSNQNAEQAVPVLQTAGVQQQWSSELTGTR